MKIGDKVTTPYGESTVSSLTERRVQRYAIVTLENGNVVKCTVDHPLIKGDGSNIDVQNLKIGEEILVKK